MRIISIEIDGDDIVFMEETEHENLFHLIKIKKIYVEQLLDKLGYVKEETGMSKEMTPKEAFRRIDISLSDYLGEGLINERKMISQSLTELEELKRDVRRFMELDYQDSDGMDDVDAIEHTRLYIKLSKVGKEE